MLTNNYLLLVNKPVGMSSFEVCNHIKKTFNVKKVGHSGTLDPLASGLLVIGINKATKFLPLLTNQDKTYQAQVLLGMQTDSYDILGNIIKKETIKLLNASEIDVVMQQFKTYLQYPPIYSAKKINGKKAYELARKGENVELQPQKVSIKTITLLDYWQTGFSFQAQVSKGTYIRSLINDICQKLNTCGCMQALKRIECNGFSLENSVTLDNIKVDDLILLDDYIKNHYPVYYQPELLTLIENGCKIKNNDYQLPCCFINNNNEVLAIYDYYKDNFIKPIFMNN